MKPGEKRLYRKRERKEANRGVARKPRLPASVPLKLPELCGDYQQLYDLFLKHAFRGGELRGNLIEVGPFHGQFINFLHTTSFFVGQPHFSVMALEPAPFNMPTAARTRTIEKTAEQFAENPKNAGMASFVIAKNVLDSPTCNPTKAFRAISLLTRKGGKVFLQANESRQMPSRELIKREGFRIADVWSQTVQGDREELIEWGLKKGELIKMILVLEKVR
jgi:hypothetical protein